MTEAFLRNVALFRGLSGVEIEAVAKNTTSRKFGRGSTIILAEQQGDAFFIIQKGRVKVSVSREGGREVILSLLGVGQVFGELSLLDGKPRSADVTATETTELIMLRRPDFLRLITEKPSIVIGLLTELAARLRKVDYKIVSLALLDVTNRVSKTLLQLASEGGEQQDQGVLLKNRPTHQQLAQMSGTTRETVTRVLRQLEEQGYIECSGRNIVILSDATIAPDEA
jgi:CRP/FNR family cyclic AMP-dependent transcriptional regulator